MAQGGGEGWRRSGRVRRRPESADLRLLQWPRRGRHRATRPPDEGPSASETAVFRLRRLPWAARERFTSARAGKACRREVGGPPQGLGWSGKRLAVARPARLLPQGDSRGVHRHLQVRAQGVAPDVAGGAGADPAASPSLAAVVPGGRSLRPKGDAAVRCHTMRRCCPGGRPWAAQGRALIAGDQNLGKAWPARAAPGPCCFLDGGACSMTLAPTAGRCEIGLRSGRGPAKLGCSAPAQKRSAPASPPDG